MSKKRSLTVIIPTNRVQFLDEAINSILAQDGNKGEILIVDDGAKPSIESQIGHRFPQVKYVRHKRNRGLPASRNTGVANSKKEYISFLDCDDLLEPEFAREMIKTCEETGAGAVVCLPYFFFSPGFPLKRKLIFLFLSMIRDVFLLVSYVFHHQTLPKDGFFLVQSSHVLFKREVLNRFPSDETYLTAANDWKLMAQILAKEKVAILPKKLSRYRYHFQSQTQTQTEKRIPRWEYYDRLLEEIPAVCQKGFLVSLFRLYSFLGRKVSSF